MVGSSKDPIVHVSGVGGIKNPTPSTLAVSKGHSFLMGHQCSFPLERNLRHEWRREREKPCIRQSQVFYRLLGLSNRMLECPITKAEKPPFRQSLISGGGLGSRVPSVSFYLQVKEDPLENRIPDLRNLISGGGGVFFAHTEPPPLISLCKLAILVANDCPFTQW